MPDSNLNNARPDSSPNHVNSGADMAQNLDIETLCLELAEEFTTAQKYVAASSMYYMLIHYVQDATDRLPRNFDSRAVASAMRVWEQYGGFPDSITDLKGYGSQSHRNPGSGGTAAFSFLKQKRYINHCDRFTWEYSSRFKEVAFGILLERMNRSVEDEGSETSSPPSTSEEVTELLGSLSVLYWYRGHSIPQDLYDTLRDDGVEGITVQVLRDGEALSSYEMAQVLMDLKSELS